MTNDFVIKYKEKYGNEYEITEEEKIEKLNNVLLSL